MTVAFVLSGGASLGAQQVGMLRAMAEAGIEPDLIVGTSVGAINGAWVASRHDAGIGGLAEVWGRLSREAVFPTKPLLGLLGFLGRRRNLVPADGIRRILRRNLTFDRMEDASIPFHVIATDLLSGMDQCISTGGAIDAITASASIPGVLPPVRIDGRDYVDGGVLNNTPISHAVAQGADTIWVFSTGYACALEQAPESALGMALHALSLTVNQRLAVDVEHYEDTVDLRVAPPLCPVPISPADFSQSAELIERAHASTVEWIANWQPRSGQAALLKPHQH